jgi:hypothetical protein
MLRFQAKPSAVKHDGNIEYTEVIRDPADTSLWTWVLFTTEVVSLRSTFSDNRPDNVKYIH